MSTSPLAILGFGFVLGLRHALDVDHLAAVSTIVSARRSLWRSLLVGALWGLGHTASLLTVAVAVIGLHLEIPASIGRLLELGVAAMLVTLGVNLLRTVLVGGRAHVHVHAHDGRLHGHPHLHAHDLADHDHGPSSRRPFFVGLVHGLAGSAGLMLAVVATIPSPALALAYVAIFGVGSVGGMTIMSALFAITALLTTGRFAGAERVLRLGAAVASVVVGLQLAWEIGLRVRFFA
jgi:ABC-type nickel/cobalt efflux system permease component RcnA